MMKSIQETFEFPNMNEDPVHLHFEKNKEKVAAFFKKDSPPKLIVFYQPFHGTDDGEGDAMLNDKRLLMTTGEGHKQEGKGVYFLRTVDEDIDPDTPNDDKILFGEINQNPLQQMKIMIENVFEPLIHNMDEREWGECDDEQKKDFLTIYSKFTDEMRTGLESLNDSTNTCTINKEELAIAQSSNSEPKFYEKLFSKWLTDFEGILKAEESSSDNNAGPETELQHWRTRLQQLTLLSELTKRNKEFNEVKKNVCNPGGKQKGDDTASNLNSRYRELENSLTEKLNEAKDNVKYLVTLEKFIEPLKFGTPQEIIETLPALMNAIKMIHTIARYYKSSQKMTNLFVKITN